MIFITLNLKNIKTLKVPKVNMWWKISVCILSLRMIHGYSVVMPYDPTWINNILAILGIGTLIISIVSENYKKSDFIITLGIMTFTLICSALIQENVLLITVFTIVALRNQNIINVVTYLYKWKLFFVLLNAGISLVFDISVYSFYYPENRYRLGFVHPNSLAMYVADLILMWVFLHFDTIKWRNILAILALNSVVFYYVKSDIAFYIIVFLCIGLLCRKVFFQQTSRVANFIARFIVPVSAIFTGVTVVLYINENPFAIIINSIMTRRISIGAIAKQNYGYTLLGQAIANQKYDNVYTYCACYAGLIWVLLLCISFYLLAKKNHVSINFMIVIFGIYALAEVQVLNGFRFFPILLLSVLFSNNHKCLKND